MDPFSKFRCVKLLCILGAGVFQSAWLEAAVMVGKDVVALGELSLMLKDFNGSTPVHSALQNNSGQPVPTHVQTANGYSTYNATGRDTSGDNSNDPKILFNTVPYDVLEYTHVRTSLSYYSAPGNTSTGVPTSEMWPNNPVTPTQVKFGALTANFSEYAAPWTDPTHTSITTATTGGFRWDPVMPSALPFDESLNFNLDYFIVDRGRVVGTEFDYITTGGMGWGPGQIDVSTLGTVLDADGNSVLRGVTTGTDPTLLKTGISLDLSIYKYVEIRLKTDRSVGLQFFWARNGAGLSEANSIKISSGDDQWHTYLIDFSGDPTMTGNLTQFRIDLGSVAGVAFDLDYVRFREIGVVPEPSRLLLMLIAGGMLWLRRRRSRI